MQAGLALPQGQPREQKAEPAERRRLSCVYILRLRTGVASQPATKTARRQEECPRGI